MTEKNNSVKRRLMSLMQHRMFGMLTCREFEAFVLDYSEGQLARGQRLSFELHLRMCPQCREYLQLYLRTVEASRSAFPDPDAPVPEDVPEELVKAILEARQN